MGAMLELFFSPSKLFEKLGGQVPPTFFLIVVKQWGDAGVVPPDPIPNSEVKYSEADDSIVFTMRK